MNGVFHQYRNTFKSYLDLVDPAQVDNLLGLILDAYLTDRRVFVIGNGGSAANASHFANDLSKATRHPNPCAEVYFPKTHNDHAYYHRPIHKRLIVQSLTDNVALLTAYANDEGYESVFKQQLMNLAHPGDFLIAISGSGNSPNILEALKMERLVTCAITGFDGGKAKELAMNSVHVELHDMPTVESIHSFIMHYVVIEAAKAIKEYHEAYIGSF